MDTADWHPLIHLRDLPVAGVQSRILDAVIALKSGGRLGIENEWDVFAVPFDQGEALVDNRQLENLRPSWWKDDGPSLVASAATLSSDPHQTRRVHIVSNLPFRTYLNSIKGKIDRPQRDPNNPYVVAVDQNAVHLRYDRLARELSPWLVHWDHVAAIMCFDPRPFVFDQFCWYMSFHPNQYSVLPLPNHVRSFEPREQKVCVNLFA